MSPLLLVLPAHPQAMCWPLHQSRDWALGPGLSMRTAGLGWLLTATASTAAATALHPRRQTAAVLLKAALAAAPYCGFAELAWLTSCCRFCLHLPWLLIGRPVQLTTGSLLTCSQNLCLHVLLAVEA
jgi:hypothetical protein